MDANLIYFDWAVKRLLRDRNNDVVLEGFLSTLLEENVRICRFLENEPHPAEMDHEFNRVDILVENEKGELFIIVIQNTRELDYFHRMLYGASEMRVEYRNLRDIYREIRKIYSINIIYFDLGQGKDYVYHGKTFFRGIHDPDDVLKLSIRQREALAGRDTGDVFLEYYMLRISEFNGIVRTPLDEWIRFFKTGKIDNEVSAKGLQEARERLRESVLSEDERCAYYRDMEALRYQRSVIQTGIIEGRAEGRAEGEKKKQQEIVRNMKSLGIAPEIIVKATGLSLEEIELL